MRKNRPDNQKPDHKSTIFLLMTNGHLLLQTSLREIFNLFLGEGPDSNEAFFPAPFVVEKLGSSEHFLVAVYFRKA